MKKLYGSDEALKDRPEIRASVAADNPAAAARLDGLFAAAARNLAAFPHLGRAGKLPGTREIMPHESYRLVYEVREDLVWILAIIHTARRWPPLRE